MSLPLTTRQQFILALIFDGLSIQGVADQAGVKRGTVKAAIRNIAVKLGIEEDQPSPNKLLALFLTEPQRFGVDRPRGRIVGYRFPQQCPCCGQEMR